MIKQIEKRDGRCVFFDVTKIANAIYKAAETSGGHDYQMSMRLALDAAEIPELEDVPRARSGRLF